MWNTVFYNDYLSDHTDHYNLSERQNSVILTFESHDFIKSHITSILLIEEVISDFYVPLQSLFGQNLSYQTKSLVSGAL